MSRPSAEEQIQFLIRIQRILDEGLFTATYKFALLLALAQISIEHGDGSGQPLVVGTRTIAEHFVRLYWRQAAPYFPADGESVGRVLKHATGKQAAIIKRLESERKHRAGSLTSLMCDRRAWRKTITAVSSVIEKMPLWKLQRVGPTELRFLYDRGTGPHEIRLLPGVVFCFRRFQPLIQDLVQGAWARFVRSIPENRPLIGTVNELGAFLFGSERAALSELNPILRDMQSGRCFYCHRAVGRSGEIDHFIPWARYSLDLGHNFVLADRECNAQKRAALASYAHLERWCARNTERGAELAERLDEKSLLHDLDASHQITAWAYAQAEDSEAQVWDLKRKFVGLDPRWRDLPGMVPAVRRM